MVEGSLDFLKRAVNRGTFSSVRETIGGRYMSTFHPHHIPTIYTEVVERAVNDLSEIVNEFDTIAVVGASCMVVGSVVAYIMKKKLAVIRKPGERPNCYSEVSHGGDIRLGRTVWLDDFISGGRTFEAAITKLKGRPRWVYLYHSGSYRITIGELAVGLEETTISEHLYRSDVTFPTDPRFDYPTNYDGAVQCSTL